MGEIKWQLPKNTFTLAWTELSVDMDLKEAYICLKASPGKMNKIKYQWESSSPIVIINSLRPTLSKV